MQAYESYPYDLSETLEALSYAISYDSSHAGAHCLLGQLNFNELKQYSKAEYHFEQALISDINYVATYEHYAMLLIITGRYNKAQRLIKYAYSVTGINVAIILHREGLMHEYQHRLFMAKKFMKLAYTNSCNQEERSFFREELERVKTKLNKFKKMKKGKKPRNK